MGIAVIFLLEDTQIKPIRVLMRYWGVLHFNYDKHSKGRGVKQPLGVCDGLGNSRVFREAV